MRKILFIVLLFICFAGHAQTPTATVCTMCAPVDTHKVNMSLILYPNRSQQTSQILYYSPVERLQFSVSTGFNPSTVSALGNGSVDLDSFNSLSVVKYDVRAKVYITKRWRFVAKWQNMGISQKYYIIGLVHKL